MDDTSQPPLISVSDESSIGPSLFNQLTSLTHQQQIVNVGNPALIWHLGYWTRDRFDDSSWVERVSDQIINLIKDFISLFELNDYSKDHFPSILNYLDFDSVNIRSYLNSIGSFVLKFETEGTKGTKISLSSERHAEFWTVKFIFDFSSSSLINETNIHLNNIKRELIKLEQVTIERFNKTEQYDKKEDANEKALELTQSISKILNNISLGLCPHIRTKKIHTPGSNAQEEWPSRKDVFLNFVGFSLGFEIIGAPVTGSSSKTIVVQRDDKFTLRRLSPKLPESVMEKIKPNANFPKSLAFEAKFVDSIWPLVKGINPYFRGMDNIPSKNASEKSNSRKSFKLNSREFTFSLLSRRRILYVSSLGAAVDRTERDLYFPLSYLLYAPHKSSWQIGRNIDKIHQLGMYRLAMLYQFKELKDANEGMRKLINQLNFRSGARNASTELRTITGQVENGLNYRLEWSRLYRRGFEETLDSLNFEKIEGYQTYKEFVLRRMLDVFITMDGAISRYRYAIRRINELNIENEAKSSRDLLQLAEVVSFFPIVYYSRDALCHLNEWFLDHHIREKYNLDRIDIFNVDWSSWWIGICFIYAVHIWIIKMILKDWMGWDFYDETWEALKRAFLSVFTRVRRGLGWLMSPLD